MKFELAVERFSYVTSNLLSMMYEVEMHIISPNFPEVLKAAKDSLNEKLLPETSNQLKEETTKILAFNGSIEGGAEALFRYFKKNLNDGTQQSRDSLKVALETQTDGIRKALVTLVQSGKTTNTHVFDYVAMDELITQLAQITTGIEAFNKINDMNAYQGNAETLRFTIEAVVGEIEKNCKAKNEAISVIKKIVISELNLLKKSCPDQALSSQIAIHRVAEKEDALKQPETLALVSLPKVDYDTYKPNENNQHLDVKLVQKYALLYALANFMATIKDEIALFSKDSTDKKKHFLVEIFQKMQTIDFKKSARDISKDIDGVFGEIKSTRALNDSFLSKFFATTADLKERMDTGIEDFARDENNIRDQYLTPVISPELLDSRWSLQV